MWVGPLLVVVTLALLLHGPLNVGRVLGAGRDNQVKIEAHYDNAIKLKPFPIRSADSDFMRVVGTDVAKVREAASWLLSMFQGRG